MGFVPAVTGLIRIDGQELNPVSVWPPRQKLAYLAQEPDLGTGGVLSRLREPLHTAATGISLDPTACFNGWIISICPKTSFRRAQTLSAAKKQSGMAVTWRSSGPHDIPTQRTVFGNGCAGRQRFIQMFREHPNGRPSLSRTKNRWLTSPMNSRSCPAQRSRNEHRRSRFSVVACTSF